MANLKTILRGGESATLEFKETCPVPHRLARTIAAFANSAGGDLVVGVKDTGEVVGLADLAQERSTLELALEYVEPRPEVEIMTLRHELKDVLVMRVSMIDFPTICSVDMDGEDVACFRIGKETRAVPSEVVKAVVRLRRYLGGVREISADGQKLVTWLWNSGEQKEPACARKFNYSSHRLRKLAEETIGAGYVLPCSMGSGRAYVAIHPGPGRR